MGLREEIFEQPAVMARFLERQGETVERVAEAIRRRGVEFVLLAARGTSDNAGVYAQYLWGGRNRLAVALAAPSLFSLYGVSPRLERALVVGISQSGQSPDVAEVIAEGRRQGALTLALTNTINSPLADEAEFDVDLSAGEEKAVAATKTYTAELMAVAALSVALDGSPDERAALARVPEAAAEALEQDEPARRMAAEDRDMEHCVVLGRGYHYTTALEWALKLKELAYVMADPYSSADFQHGPIALIEPGFPILAVAPSGATLPNMLTLLKRLKEEHSAQLLVVSDDPQAQALAERVLPLPAGLPEWLVPLAGILPGQLYCYHLTLAKGYNPETPRSIRKITRTH